MPNTVVKLTNAESTWLEAAREDRKLLIKKKALIDKVSAFLLCVSFEVMGFCEGFGGKLYSRRLTPCGRGLMAPPGLTALGAKGSVRDRLTPYRQVEGSRPRKVYSTAALARWAPLHYRRRPLMKKNSTTALRAWEMHSPFGGWRHHLALWEACHWIRGSPTAPL